MSQNRKDFRTSLSGHVPFTVLEKNSVEAWQDLLDQGNQTSGNSCRVMFLSESFIKAILPKACWIKGKNKGLLLIYATDRTLPSWSILTNTGPKPSRTCIICLLFVCQLAQSTAIETQIKQSTWDTKPTRFSFSSDGFWSMGDELVTTTWSCKSSKLLEREMEIAVDFFDLQPGHLNHATLFLVKKEKHL